MSKIIGVLFCCEVCGKETFCNENKSSGYFCNNGYTKIYYDPPDGWDGDEMCPDCARRIRKAINNEKDAIRLDEHNSNPISIEKTIDLSLKKIKIEDLVDIDLGISTLTKNALLRDGIHDLYDLKATDWYHILLIRNISKESACRLAAVVLFKYGFCIYDESDKPSIIKKIDNYVKYFKKNALKHAA